MTTVLDRASALQNIVPPENAAEPQRIASIRRQAAERFSATGLPSAYDEEWKKKVRARILRSDGVLVIVSKNSLNSSGQKWEIQCAKEEKKKVRGIWAYKDDRTDLAGVNTMVWTWDNIAAWIDNL